MTSVTEDTLVPEAERCTVPPPADRLPRYPSTWYRFCSSKELRDKPVSKQILGRKILAYRTAKDALVVMDGRCAHLAADLGLGTVKGENIACPFHGWEYCPTGACIHIPGGGGAATFARLNVYPAEERQGSIYFFNGSAPLFPLPFLEDEEPDDYIAGRSFPIFAHCPWYICVSNGFDVALFNTVHDRVLTSEPKADAPAPYARRMRFCAEVSGDSISDRVLRQCAGPTVEVSITSWGGPFMTVTANFRRTKSRMLILGHPLEDEKTMMEVIVLSRRRSNPILGMLDRYIGLEVRRLFTREFLRGDMHIAAGLKYNPYSLVEADRSLIDYYHWIAESPQATFSGGDQ